MIKYNKNTKNWEFWHNNELLCVSNDYNDIYNYIFTQFEVGRNTSTSNLSNK